MTRHGKRYRQASGAVPKNVQHGLEDAVELLVELPKAKFDEAVELHGKWLRKCLVSFGPAGEARHSLLHGQFEVWLKIYWKVN